MADHPGDLDLSAYGCDDIDYSILLNEDFNLDVPIDFSITSNPEASQLESDKSIPQLADLNPIIYSQATIDSLFGIETLEEYNIDSPSLFGTAAMPDFNFDFQPFAERPLVPEEPLAVAVPVHEQEKPYPPDGLTTIAPAHFLIQQCNQTPVDVTQHISDDYLFSPVEPTGATANAPASYSPTSWHSSALQLQNNPAPVAPMMFPSPMHSSQLRPQNPSLASSLAGPPSLPFQRVHDFADGGSAESSPALKSARPIGPIRVDKKKIYGEKPKLSSEQPWIRVNACTKGDTSRSSKINHYKADDVYEQIPHPLGGEWSTRGGKKFEYNKWGELLRYTFSFNMLKDFVYQHPKTEDCTLTLFIQRSPADSRRRYPTKDSPRCRFAECTMREHKLSGNITHGHYRVALDELSHKYSNNERNDPMIVPGYVHLYCLERFLDFPALCQLPNVRVVADHRTTLFKEPNGKFQAALSGNDYRIAHYFIEACKTGNLRSHADFEEYPEHEEFRDANSKRQVRSKNHTKTLNYMLQQSRNTERSLRVRESTALTTLAVNGGDLDIYCKAKRGIYTKLADIPDYREPTSTITTVNSNPDTTGAEETGT